MKNFILVFFCFFITNNISSQTWPKPWTKWVSKEYGMQLRTRQLGQQVNPRYTRWEIEWRKTNNSIDICKLHVKISLRPLGFNGPIPNTRPLFGCAFDSSQLSIHEYDNVSGATEILNSYSFILEDNKSSSTNNNQSNSNKSNIKELKRKATTASLNGNHQTALNYYKEIKLLNPNEPNIDRLIKFEQSSINLNRTLSKNKSSTTATIDNNNSTHNNQELQNLESYDSDILIKSKFYNKLSTEDKKNIIEKRLKTNCGGIKFNLEEMDKELELTNKLSDAEGKIVKKLWNENPNLALYNKSEWERQVNIDPDVIKAKKKLDNFKKECTLLREELEKLKK